MHLLFQCGEKPDWLKLRQTVHDYCYAVIPGPIAMDVGAITKGRGKGKSKRKYESHGDGGKGKKGQKGKQVWNMETPEERLLVSQKKGTPSQPCFSRWTGSIMLSTSADILFISHRILPDGIDARCDRPLRS